MYYYIYYSVDVVVVDDRRHCRHGRLESIDRHCRRRRAHTLEWNTPINVPQYNNIIIICAV